MKVSAVLFSFSATLALAGMAFSSGERPDRSPVDRPLSSYWIGYTEQRTNLAGGRHANVSTARACLVRADGSGQRVLAEDLCRKPDCWTQFAGWSPDGRTAVILSGYNSPANAAWEE
jgi:hypothetical protein